MLTIFMAVAQSIIDSGFGSSLIQKQDASHVDECSIFYFNVVVGLIAAGAMCVCAPWIAAFYRTPLLVPLSRVLSLNLIINSFGIIQTTLLTKRVEFKKQFVVSLIATIASGGVGVAMAYCEYGVWSLVGQSVSSNLMRTILLWFVIRWRPAPLFSMESLRSMFPFGSRMLLSGLLETVFSNLYLLVIGKVSSATDLGYYSRAQQTQQFPVVSLSSAVNRVTYPVFAKVQTDKVRLKRGVAKALTTLAMVGFPVMIGLAVVSRPLVSVLLTDKWLPSVPYLQLLCVVGLLYPLHAINLNVLKAQGRSDLHLRLEIIKKALNVIAIGVTWSWGITAMICGQLVVSAAAYYLNSYYTGKLLDYRLWEQLRDVLPTCVLACAMGLGVYAVGLVECGNDLVLLMIQVAAGVLLYGVLCHIAGLSSFMEMESMLLARLGRSGSSEHI